MLVRVLSSCDVVFQFMVAATCVVCQLCAL